MENKPKNSNNFDFIKTLVDVFDNKPSCKNLIIMFKHELIKKLWQSFLLSDSYKNYWEHDVFQTKTNLNRK